MQTRCERALSADGRGFAETGTVIFEEREFASGGAWYHPDADRIVGYLSEDCRRLCTWSGEYLGTARVTARWRTPRSYVSSEMCQVEATVDGVTYTGRSCGGGMLYRGKRKKGRCKS